VIFVKLRPKHSLVRCLYHLFASCSARSKKKTAPAPYLPLSLENSFWYSFSGANSNRSPWWRAVWYSVHMLRGRVQALFLVVGHLIGRCVVQRIYHMGICSVPHQLVIWTQGRWPLFFSLENSQGGFVLRVPDNTMMSV